MSSILGVSMTLSDARHSTRSSVARVSSLLTVVTERHVASQLKAALATSTELEKLGGIAKATAPSSGSSDSGMPPELGGELDNVPEDDGGGGGGCEPRLRDDGCNESPLAALQLQLRTS